MGKNKRQTITAHCIVRNDENFVYFAIESVINYVDYVIVFDTGSTDTTEQVVKKLVEKYPDKITFKQKGIQTKASHTDLRQEMLEMTTTDWFMILDGDEVWTERGIKEIVETIQKPDAHHWMIAPYYLCVGDVYHTYYKEKYEPWYGKTGFYTPRVIKMNPDIEWRGDYELDTLYYKSTGKHVYTNDDMYFLKSKFWHLTHLARSNDDDKVYTSGLHKTRAEKRRLTYTCIGRKIKEGVPEVFNESMKMNVFESLLRFFWLVVSKPVLLLRFTKLKLLKKE